MIARSAATLEELEKKAPSFAEVLMLLYNARITTELSRDESASFQPRLERDDRPRIIRLRQPEGFSSLTSPNSLRFSAISSKLPAAARTR